MTLDVFHFEISGKEDNELHPLNILDIFLTSDVFHFEISGKEDNELH